MKSTNFFVTSLLLLLISCGSIKQKVTVPIGVIKTEGVKISAEDDSFVLESGKIWTSPFQNDTHGYGMHGKNADMVNFFKLAVDKMGAKKVRVKVPYQTKELYGVLLLSKIYDGCSSAVTRSYQISIPKSYVEKALNGKVSVLYEYYTACGVVKDMDPLAKTWVLWLSDIPF